MKALTLNHPNTGIVILVCLFLFALSCQPEDEQPGLWLGGEEVTEVPQDWRFTDEIEEIFIETRPWYGLPHSTTIWCVELDGVLYVGSYGPEEKAWEAAVASDPQVRLEIDGRLYPVEVHRLPDSPLSQAVNQRYFEKYDMEEVFGEDVPEWWFYRVAPRLGENQENS